MGLLDALVPFTPGGGLLDFLRQNAAAAIANNPGVMASDQAQYGGAMPGLVPGMQASAIMPADQPNAIDSARWPQGPVGAPTQATAAVGQPAAVAPQQPAMAQQPMQAAPSGPNFFNQAADALASISRGGSLLGAVRGQFDDPKSAAAQSSNVTARALIAKGVPPETAIAAVQPGNAELLKTLIGQHFGPETIQSLGSGYVYRPRSGKIERAYEPDDKTPEGFSKNADGTLRAIPGGPADPKYMSEKSASEGRSNVAATIEDRKRAATAIGLTPDHPAYQGYILTGKMPREDAQPLTATDKKAILEADEHVQATQQGIDNLRQAKELSKKAYAGPLASVRGYAGSLIGDEAATATTDLNNLVMTNALQQLKATFGGNPTEGERAILLDIQGSANQPDAVRQKIYDRAIAAMERRQAFEKERADGLRGGTFYKAGKGGTAAPPPAAAPGATTPAAKPATVTQNGHTYTLQSDGSYK